MKYTDPNKFFDSYSKDKKDEYNILHGVYHGLCGGSLSFGSDRKMYLSLEKRGLIKYYEGDRLFIAKPTTNGKKYFDEMEKEYNLWLRRYFPSLFRK